MTPKTAATTTKYVAYGFIAVVIIWGLAPYGPISEPARLLLDLLDWPFGDAAPALTRSEMWLSSIGAGLTFAICIMLLGIVVPAYEKGDRKTIRVTLWAFIAWFVVDGAGSAASGVPSNIFFNSILFVAILVPLLMVRFDTETR
ncbi:MAG TPA: hypothetical protein ENJ90_09240 [Devosia sp.]|nr:hypothetical protein [Devosia sp.]